MEKRENFSSRLGFVLVSAGCAIGLGNVWKFPYMCGQYGGALFILIYLLFLVILGFPIMVCEFSVGRASKASCATSFKRLEPNGTRWHKYGYFGMAGNYILMMFYTTVAGWMLYYFYRTAIGEFASAQMTVAEITAKFGEMTSSAPTMTLWMVITVVMAFAICAAGVQKGVERVSKVMMLCLLGLIAVLAVNSLLLPGAGEGVKFFLVPNFDTIKEVGFGNIVFGALSQSFFTLSVGIGSMAIFGSYIDRKRSLAGEAVSIAVLDTFVAIMAGLIIIPACFAFNIEQNAGPSLIFITLPNIFNRMAGGQIWGTLFFLFLSFAALSTVIAGFENIISFAMDLWGWSRRKSVIVNMIAIICLSLPCIFGFNILSGITPLGEGTNIMDLEDFIVSNNLLPIGSLVYLMFCVSRNGWGWDNFIKEANAGKGMKFPVKLRWYMTYILPVIIVAIYLKGYYDIFSTKGLAYLIPWFAAAVVFLGLLGWIVFSKKKNI